MSGDPRLTLARPDLAAAGLEGLVRAGRFDETRPMRVIAPSAAIRAAPDADAEQLDALLFGEVFDVLEIVGAFAWGQAARDGYVGFAPLAALSAQALTPTHRVAALRTFAFAEPTIKAPTRGPYSLNALVTVSRFDGRLALVEDAGWTPLTHLVPVGGQFETPAATAERFVGTPYLWGGRDSVGLDCSGLVQQALYAAGLACPRDADQQSSLGAAIGPEALERGDLVFWRGHVGMMADGERLVHANAHHMAVAIEPLAEAWTRIAQAGGGDPTGFRRL